MATPIYTRCPTPGCKTPLPREALELLLEPEADQAHLARARRSYEQRLRDLQARTAAGSNDDDDGTAAFLAWAGDSTRACPECHVLIYRSEGCAHMSCACGAEFNWDSAERVGGSSAAPPPTAPGARRVVGAEDIAALLPPAFPDTLAGVGLLPGGVRAAAAGAARRRDSVGTRPGARTRSVARAPAGARPHACQIATNRRNRRGRHGRRRVAGRRPDAASSLRAGARGLGPRRFKPGGGRRSAAGAAPRRSRRGRSEPGERRRSGAELP